MTSETILKYPGSKQTLAPHIVSRFPTHRIYLEPFFGSGAVFFAKPRTRVEIVNDLDSRVVNLFAVLRDRPEALARAVWLTPWSAQEHREYDGPDSQPTGDPVEDARRFLVVAWQSHGADSKWRNGWRRPSRNGEDHHALYWIKLPDRLLRVAERLRGVVIEQRTALEVIERHGDPACLIYADPPYPLSTRYRSYYRHEMKDVDHLALLDALERHPGPVVLSGYACPLYDERLGHWQREEVTALAEGGRVRTEVIWRNARAAVRTLFDTPLATEVQP